MKRCPALERSYLYGGASGGSYPTNAAGFKDNSQAAGKVNSPGSAIVINPAVTAANGFPGPNYFNASNFVCQVLFPFSFFPLFPFSP